MYLNSERVKLDATIPRKEQVQRERKPEITGKLRNLVSTDYASKC